MERRLAVRAVIVKEGKIFCVRLKPYRHKDASEYWCTVGGGVDPGEPVVIALQREVFEEVGVKPVVGNLLFVQQYIHKGVEQTELFFNIENIQDFENIDLAATTHGQEEIEEYGFVDPKSVRVLPEFLSEVDWASFDTKGVTKIFDYITV